MRRGIAFGFGFAGNAVDFEAETDAWEAAVVGDGGTVSGVRKTLVNDLIVGLKGDGIWTQLDRLWLFAAANSQSALRDLVAASAATPISSPTFAADDGYTGDGSSSYLETNFNAATAPGAKFLQDDAHFSHWNLTNDTSNQGLCGNSNTSTSMQYFAGAFYPRVNDSGNPVTLADPRGHLLANRTASDSRTAYKNASSIGAVSASSGAVVNQQFFVLNDSNTKSATQCAAFSIGGGLTEPEITDFYNRLRTYMTAVGVP